MGWMELRVGSNITIDSFSLYIAAFPMAHVLLCVCISDIVSCHNYMYYVCETLKMLENVVKRSEFVYTRE